MVLGEFGLAAYGARQSPQATGAPVSDQPTAPPSLASRITTASSATGTIRANFFRRLLSPAGSSAVRALRSSLFTDRPGALSDDWSSHAGQQRLLRRARLKWKLHRRVVSGRHDQAEQFDFRRSALDKNACFAIPDRSVACLRAWAVCVGHIRCGAMHQFGLSYLRPVINLEAGPVNYNATSGTFLPQNLPMYKTAADFGQWCGVVAAHEKAAFPAVSQFTLPGNEVNSNPAPFPWREPADRYIFYRFTMRRSRRQVGMRTCMALS
jgi:hypothetical protein